MSSSPSSAAAGRTAGFPPARSVRVIRRTGGLLPPASVVAPRASVPAMALTEPGTSLEALLDATRQEAFGAGRQDGLEEASRAAEARRTDALVEAVGRVSRLTVDLAALRVEVVDEVVGDAVDLAFELLEVLVGRELALATDPVRDAVTRALALVPGGQDLVVRLHPDSVLGDRDVAELVVGAQVDVVRDPDVDPWGCRVSAGACNIDAQIPSALERVRHCLDELRPRRPATTRVLRPATAAPAAPAGPAPAGPAPGDVDRAPTTVGALP